MKAEQLIAEKGIEYARKAVESAPKANGIKLVLIGRYDYFMYATRDLSKTYDTYDNDWFNALFSIRNGLRDMVDIEELRNAIS